MRVLVVEDARRPAAGIAEGLRDEGMAVDLSYDGVDALSKLAVNLYDVVVLDRDLPGVHGDVVCRQIVGQDEGPMVLMLTAADEPFQRGPVCVWAPMITSPSLSISTSSSFGSAALPAANRELRPASCERPTSSSTRSHVS